MVRAFNHINKRVYNYKHGGADNDRDDDDIDDEEDGDLHTVVVDGALVFCVGVNGAVQQPTGGDRLTE